MRFVAVASSGGFAVAFAFILVACETDSAAPGAPAFGFDAALQPFDGSTPIADAAAVGDVSDAGPDASSDGATEGGAACAQAQAGWSTDRTTYLAASTATLIHDFETRADGSIPVAGTEIPPDEYLSCCGFRIRFESDQAGSKLIWAGNPTGGFGARINCETLGCTKADIIVELTKPASALGVEYPGSIVATMRDAADAPIATQTLDGAGELFVGYRSTAGISSAVFSRAGGSEITALYARTCP